MKHRFTDIHQHLLYGLDDGARDLKHMCAMLRCAAEQGIGHIIATPHVTPGVIPFSVERCMHIIGEAKAFCAHAQLDMDISLGAEILYTQQTGRFLEEGRIPTLGDSDRILVEFSPDISQRELCAALEQILGVGYLPVIAHVERYRCLVKRPSLALQLRENFGVFYQLNCNTLLHKLGFFQGRFVKRMLEAGMIDAIATDAHNTGSRAARMLEAWAFLDQNYGPEYAGRLTNGSLLRD